MLCTWVRVHLDGSTRSESLPERTFHFEPPEHVPRTSARAQTCVRGPGGLPAFHGAESTRKDPRPEEKKMLKGQKNTFIYIYVQDSLSGCGRREIPGVSQVGKGNAGKKSHVVLIVEEKSAGVLYCEKGREEVSKNTYGSLPIYQV